VAESPGGIGGDDLGKALDRHTPGQAARQDERKPGPDTRDPVGVALPVRGERSDGPRTFLAVVRAHCVDGPVRQGLPQCFGVIRGPQRRRDQVALAIGSLVAVVIQDQMVQADFGVQYKRSATTREAHLITRLRAG
jgi:hypothetical protein